MFSKQDYYFMQQALLWAHWAAAQDEVPVGAVLVKDNEIIAAGWNQSIHLQDPSAHAEIIALRKAGMVLENYRLVDTTLYVTLEPCIMCVGAMLHARIKRLIFAASDPKTGAVKSVFPLMSSDLHYHHIIVNSGLLADKSSALLRAFFRSKRNN